MKNLENVIDNIITKIFVFAGIGVCVLSVAPIVGFLIVVLLTTEKVEYTVTDVYDNSVFMIMDDKEYATVEFERTEQPVKVGDKFTGVYNLTLGIVDAYGYDGECIEEY